MTILDLIYLTDSRNKPGRSVLKVSTAQPFEATATESGGQIKITLPAPASGFVRQWDMLTSQVTALANGNGVFLRWFNPSGIAILMNQVNFRTGFLPAFEFPLIRARWHGWSTDVTPVFAQLVGIEPIIQGNLDLMDILWLVTAASGQTATARGRYIDFPI